MHAVLKAHQLFLDFTLFPLPLRCLSFLRLSCYFPRNLIRPPQSNGFWSKITIERFQSLLNRPTSNKVQDHHGGQIDFEVRVKGYELQLFVDLWHELCRAAEGNTADQHDAVKHASVLSNAFAEWAALVVDGKGRDLLDELQQVDCRVEQGWFEFLLRIWVEVRVLGRRDLGDLRDVDEGDDMDGELSEDRAYDVRIEDVGLRPLFRELFNRLIKFGESVRRAYGAEND